ncbi:MAG: Fe-S biogenesis protein NfuA [Gammaproteobacteria bacterium]|nr:Fe-S biogenesis protein NfuA [Gammaproteobacteria bacterium]
MAEMAGVSKDKTMRDSLITITELAQTHFRELLSKQRDREMQLRIEVLEANSPQPECGIRFFKPDLSAADDLVIGFDGFMLYVEAKSLPYLEGTFIDFVKDGLNGELYIETPNLKPHNLLDPEWPIATQVQFLLDTEVNLQLAMHGGAVALVEVSADKVVILQFSGGCQGCSMASMTLKEGVEKQLRERIPQITAVQDVTDHEGGANPYF